MCQEIHLSDVRLALLDYCEAGADGSHRVSVDELLDRLAGSEEGGSIYAFEHESRAHRLAAGEEGGASSDGVLLQDLARAAG